MAWLSCQIGGQDGELTERTGRQGSFQAHAELLSGQPTVHRGLAQDLRDPVPVCIRRPHPGRCTGSGRFAGR